METRAAVAAAAGKPLSIETVTLDGPREGERGCSEKEGHGETRLVVRRRRSEEVLHSLTDLE